MWKFVCPPKSSNAQCVWPFWPSMLPAANTLWLHHGACLWLVNWNAGFTVKNHSQQKEHIYLCCQWVLKIQGLKKNHNLLIIYLPTFHLRCFMALKNCSQLDSSHLSSYPFLSIISIKENLLNIFLFSTNLHYWSSFDLRHICFTKLI